MNRRIPGFLATVALTALVAACSSAAPAPAPTSAPAPAATKAPAAQPTVASAAPTAAPAAKAAFPEKGKTITVLIPFAAGGGADVQIRMMQPDLEAALGVQLNMTNKTGAGSQVGITDLVKSKADGYTMGATNTPSGFMPYLDPERKAAYGRKDLQPIANVAVDPSAVAVKADSPYKTLKDLLDAAKAKPNALKAGTGGLMSAQHIGTTLLEKAAGVQFAPVHFEGGAPALTNLIGGHVDVAVCQVGEELPHVKAGNVRVLAVMDKERSRFMPDVPTAEELGYKAYGDSSRGYSLPGGTPKEIVKVWEDALKKASSSPSFKSKMEEQGISLRWLGTADYEAYWDKYEEQIKPLLPDLKRQ